MADNEGIQPLSGAVLNRAMSEADQILAEARAKADRLREEPHQRAEQARRDIIAPAEREAKRIRQQATVSAQLKAQNLRLQRREQLLADVFQLAQERIPSVREWPNYTDIVRRLTREALASLDVDAARVRADKQTRVMLGAGILKELSDSLGIDLKLGPALEEGTGVLVETLDGHRMFDNTLEARLDRRRDALRGPVYRLLIGEKTS